MKAEFEDRVIALAEKLELTNAQVIPRMVSLLMSLIHSVTKEPHERRQLVDQIHETMTRKLVIEGRKQ